MVTLTGNTLSLRALEPEDLEFVYSIENDESVWEVSSTQTPYSRFLIRQYLENAHQDIYEAKQLRLAICLKTNGTTIGLIDLYDFDPANRRAGIGIVIQHAEERGKGYGKEALGLLINFAFTHLNLHQLYATVGEDNTVSLQLFTGFGFQIVGTKKDWILSNGSYKNEILLQLIPIK